MRTPAVIIAAVAALALIGAGVSETRDPDDQPDFELVAQERPGLPPAQDIQIPDGEPDAATSAAELPVYESANQPGWLHSSDNPASNYQMIWAYPISPTTPYRSPDSHKQISRYLLLDPRYKDADGNQGHDEWWFIMDRYYPSSYQAGNHGKWGRHVNFHNVAGDAGSAECSCGGVGWGFGAGSSALALDWNPGQPSPTFSLLTAYRGEGGFEAVLPVPTRDQWHTYVMRWVAGRTDRTTVRPGEVTIWVDGKDEPVVDRRGLNTVQRARGPDGGFYVQRWMTLWEGDYTSALPVEARLRFTLTRIGRTFREALNDRPRLKSATTDGDRYVRVSGDAPRPSLETKTPLPADDSKLPPSLTGDSDPVDPLPLATTSQTALRVTFSWMPPENSRGYVFTVDGKRVSHTLDQTRSSVTFGKVVGTHVYGVQSLAPGPDGDESLTR